MFFLSLNKVQINFANQKPNWKNYILDKALLSTKQVQIIDWKKFAVAALTLD